MRKLVLIALTMLFAIWQNASYAQGCVACRATAEQQGETTGSNIAEGLNLGIIYLMIIPYILLMILFRKKIFKFIKEFASMRN